jgi:hypothetical protein
MGTGRDADGRLDNSGAVLQEHFRQHGVAVFAPFAIDHFDQHALAVDMFGLQSPDFPDPESCRVGGHQHQSVFDVAGALMIFQTCSLVSTVGSLARFFGQSETDFDLLIQDVFVEKAQAGQTRQQLAGALPFSFFRYSR